MRKEKTSSPASLPGRGTPPHKDDLGDCVASVSPVDYLDME